MHALAAAPFGRRPGLSELLQQPRRAKPHAWGPGGRGLSPGHAGMGEAEVTPMLQPAGRPPHSVLLTPNPPVSARSPCSVRRIPSTCGEKGWSPCLLRVVTLVVSQTPLPGVAADPTPLLGRLPALPTRPLFVHRYLQHAPNPAALPAQQTRSCFVLCPLDALFPFCLLSPR